MRSPVPVTPDWVCGTGLLVSPNRCMCRRKHVYSHVGIAQCREQCRVGGVVRKSTSTTRIKEKEESIATILNRNENKESLKFIKLVESVATKFGDACPVELGSRLNDDSSFWGRGPKQTPHGRASWDWESVPPGLGVSSKHVTALCVWSKTLQT